MNATEIRKMSVDERLQAMEILWDSLLDDEVEISSPDWHREILRERLRAIEEGQAELVSISDLKTTGTE
jgi:putative addiction module component (TIGR02574 family)